MLTRQREYLEPDRRINNDLQAQQNNMDKEDDIDIAREDLEDYEANVMKRRRRPPVDPTLLMMGIGRRKWCAAAAATSKQLDHLLILL